MPERSQSIKHDGPSSRLILEMPLNGNLDQVVRLFIKTLGAGLQAIALALSTPQDNSTEVQKRIDQLTASLKPEADAFEGAAKPQ